MSTVLNQTWELDSLFANGSASEAFTDYLAQLRTEVGELAEEIHGLNPDAHLETWVQVLTKLQYVALKFRDAGAFVSCLTAQNTKDEAAKSLQGKISDLSAKFNGLFAKVDETLLGVSADRFTELKTHEKLQSIAFALEENRARAATHLTADKEALISDLRVDGYSAWGEFYDQLVSKISIPFDDGEQVVQLSAGQAANKMVQHDRAIRAQVFDKFESAFSQSADLFASTLNHLAGFRLATYRQRGWDNVLQEPLTINRMQEQTLFSMWNAIAANKQPLVTFLNRKAKLLGLEKLSWYDVAAPLGAAGRKMSFEEARAFIVEHFTPFSQQMADFADMCFENRWIEAEDRPDKKPGGFCTNFPFKEQSRIFVTFSGAPSNVATLAHEIGHAYHQYVMRDLPYFTQRYAMNVAETASTFAEMIVADAALTAADSKEERIILLEDKIHRAVTMFMNIHARFLFETRFYEQRKQGLVSARDLNALMVQAQEEAFAGALDTYHPHFWASRLHFHITGVPFYNFPYTFGYLFSNGIYARARKEGPQFADKYVALLRDTANMTVEDLAMKHLGVDLREPDFWLTGIDGVIADIEEFLALTES